MKVLCVDIDGCLNSYQSIMLYDFLSQYHFESHGDFINKNIKLFCPMALSNLAYIIRSTQCKLVLSSCWRKGQTLDSIKEWFSPWSIIANAFIDVTPVLCGVQRGMEIKTWLGNHPEVIKYAVIDDDDDFDDVRGNFFKIDPMVGLNLIVAKKIVKHFIAN
jgi:hypothetical protein